MTTRNINLLWKSFKGIRKLNTINSDVEFGADIAHGVRLSKEKSGQYRSIRSSGWLNTFAICGSISGSQTQGSSLNNINVSAIKFDAKMGGVTSGSTVFTYDGNDWYDSNNEKVLLVEYGISFSGTPVASDAITVTYSFEDVIRLFHANMSGYGPDQLVAFTKTSGAINAWIICDSTYNSVQTKIATFPLASDVTDVCMIQWGDRLVMVAAFGDSTLGFVCYSATSLIGWTQMSGTDFYYRSVVLSGTGMVGTTPIKNITRVCPYRSRLAINGRTEYAEPDPQDPSQPSRENIYGIWFSEAGNAVNFTMDYIDSATETSAFFVETGEYVNQLEEYHGLTAFCRNRSYNVTGTSQNDIKVMPLTAKGVFGNAAFTINGKCAYVDSWSNNIFTLRDNIDGTIGFDDPVGDDVQGYLYETNDVTVNSVGRKVRLTKHSGQSLVYDVDVQEWIDETLPENARVETFLNKEYVSFNSKYIYNVIDNWEVGAIQFPDENGYYSHYRTNLIWLDSQSSVKSHLYPFAIILEPNTSNDFFIKFTTDRGDTFNSRITKAGYPNVATYSIDDMVPEDGSQFVNDDDDTSGRVFFAMSQTDVLVTAERPPFWRYLQIDIYTTSESQQFNISGIEAKNTVITDEMLEY